MDPFASGFLGGLVCGVLATVAAYSVERAIQAVRRQR
jgi:fructose-specific phosphotransferase system IIC component